MRIRLATTADQPSLAAFDEWNAATPARIGAGTCHVAERNGALVGFGILDRSFMNRPFVAILFVHPEHRRTGVGDALLAHFEALTSEKELWVSTNIENLPMQRALHRRGYRLTGVVNELGAKPELFYLKPLTT